MEIEKYMRGGTTVLALHGALGSSEAEATRERLTELLPGEGSVLFDLSEMRYLSSAGLRVLLLVYRQVRGCGVRLMLTGLRPEVNELMAATGFLGFFTVADTVDAGIAGIGELGG